MRHFEFWHPRVFETPYYVYLLLKCLRHGLRPIDLVQANYGLDHGELGLGSKFDTQQQFSAEWFPATQLMSPASDASALDASALKEAADCFASEHGFPLIAKPDIGAVGKGIVKLSESAELHNFVEHITTPHLLQVFTPLPEEYGVFFVRKNGINQITGINQKHFPEVFGNGRDTIQTLVEAHPRHTSHWDIFLRYIDTTRVPTEKERVRLSFIGSHTMGCKFTNDTTLLTQKLEQAIFEFCDTQPGFNFGRLDVRAQDQDAFQRGDFVVIEVNGIASLPTHMFDPEHSLLEGYRIFLRHGRHLVEAAREHRHEPMQVDSLREIWRKAKSNHALLNAVHDATKKPGHTGRQNYDQASSDP